jgi:ribosomal protein L31
MTITSTHVDFTCDSCDEIFEAYEMNRVRAIVQEDEMGDISMNVDVCSECATDMQEKMKAIEDNDGTIVPVLRVEVLEWVNNLKLEFTTEN